MPASTRLLHAGLAPLDKTEVRCASQNNRLPAKKNWWTRHSRPCDALPTETHKSRGKGEYGRTPSSAGRNRSQEPRLAEGQSRILALAKQGCVMTTGMTPLCMCDTLEEERGPSHVILRISPAASGVNRPGEAIGTLPTAVPGRAKLMPVCMALLPRAWALTASSPLPTPGLFFWPLPHRLASPARRGAKVRLVTSFSSAAIPGAFLFSQTCTLSIPLVHTTISLALVLVLTLNSSCFPKA